MKRGILSKIIVSLIIIFSCILCFSCTMIAPLKVHQDPDICKRHANASSFDEIGEGTSEEPYQLCYASQFESMAANPEAASGKYYELANDIYFETLPNIGPISNIFLYGNNKIIFSNTGSTSNLVGLFEEISNSTLVNIKLSLDWYMGELGETQGAISVNGFGKTFDINTFDPSYLFNFNNISPTASVSTNTSSLEGIYTVEHLGIVAQTAREIIVEGMEVTGSIDLKNLDLASFGLFNAFESYQSDLTGFSVNLNITFEESVINGFGIIAANAEYLKLSDSDIIVSNHFDKSEVNNFGAVFGNVANIKMENNQVATGIELHSSTISDSAGIISNVGAGNIENNQFNTFLKLFDSSNDSWGGIVRKNSSNIIKNKITTKMLSDTNSYLNSVGGIAEQNLALIAFNQLSDILISGDASISEGSFDGELVASAIAINSGKFVHNDYVGKLEVRGNIKNSTKIAGIVGENTQHGVIQYTDFAYDKQSVSLGGDSVSSGKVIVTGEKVAGLVYENQGVVDRNILSGFSIYGDQVAGLVFHNTNTGNVTEAVIQDSLIDGPTKDSSLVGGIFKLDNIENAEKIFVDVNFQKNNAIQVINELPAIDPATIPDLNNDSVRNFLDVAIYYNTLLPIKNLAYRNNASTEQNHIDAYAKAFDKVVPSETIHPMSNVLDFNNQWFYDSNDHVLKLKRFPYCDGSTNVFFSMGYGSLDLPYVICSSEQLVYIIYHPDLWNKHFKLVDDIRVKDILYSDLGSLSKPFSGSIDGQGFKIEFKKTCLNSNYCGLFGVNSGDIKNLTVKGDLTVSDYSGYPSQVGVLVGINNKSGNIERVKVSGEIIAIDSNSYKIGGIVGLNKGAIENVATNVKILAPYSDHVGGVVGFHESGYLRNVYVGSKLIHGRDYVASVAAISYAPIEFIEVNPSRNIPMESAIAENMELIGRSFVGGLVGKNYNTLNYAVIANAKLIVETDDYADLVVSNVYKPFVNGGENGTISYVMARTKGVYSSPQNEPLANVPIKDVEIESMPNISILYPITEMLSLYGPSNEKKVFVISGETKTINCDELGECSYGPIVEYGIVQSAEDSPEVYYYAALTHMIVHDSWKIILKKNSNVAGHCLPTLGANIKHK